MNKQLIILLLLISLLSCNSKEKQLANIQVEYKGALKNMMHKGDISAKAKLSDFENIKHFYALGASENLKGEIQILNSKPYNTSVIDSSLIFDNSYEKNATLLVYATVNKWNSFKIPDEIKTYEQLENFINLTAKANEINTDEPFPFFIEGKPKYVDWHVINWKDGDMEHSHIKHINSGLNGRLYNEKVNMLGFYSNSHHAIFTHHTTNMHMHLVTADKDIAGHVDDIYLNNGMVLKLPSI